MGSSFSLIDQIHSQALETSARFKKAKADMVEVFQQVEKHRVFLTRGYSSLFAYAVTELQLSENVTYNLITVSRKAREVPALLDHLKTGKITFSNARRVASVLTAQNQAEWIQKASTLSNRRLEKEIVKVRPREATREHASYVSPDRVRLELGLSERAMLKLRRVQDLLSQSQRRAVSLEETIAALTQEYLQRHDPVEKAKRHRVKKGVPAAGSSPEAKSTSEAGVPVEISSPTPLVTLRVVPRRTPSPAAVLHQVHWRDQGKCSFILPDGSRCEQTRWIEIHHRVPVSQGGPNTVENLETLCSSHHRFLHGQGGLMQV